MNTRPIGETGLSVGPICFGTSALGDMPETYGYGVGEAEARRTIHAILDSPQQFMDTSRNYGDGRSEARIGAVIRERGGLPPGFILSTKLDRDPATNSFNAARARRSLEESLTALGLDRVHLLHLHDPEYVTDLGEVTGPDGSIEELFRMKEEGLADAVGLAMGRLDVMAPILAAFPFDAIISHNRYTLLNRSANALFDQAHKRGIAILNAAPYASGVLAKGADAMPRITYQDADEAALAPVRRIEAVCRAHGVAPGAAALQFSLRDPRIAATLVGVTRPERLVQTAEWAEAAVPDVLWEELEALPVSTDDPEAGRVI